ncbi:MAG TPA: bifunctional riboflavin kinase/FAD synthetase [Mycobacteriales bacterium]|nr:bifunctional riboflavin kinase/FAD synthetase [Mycobacteriales bacterium]
MLRWRGLDGVPFGWGRCVVTIGVFDGVHRGHQKIIGRAVERARDMSLPSVVLTFDPHPSEVVRPGSHPLVLTQPRRKAEVLEVLGVDALCVLPFTLEFSRLPPADFVHLVLVERLHAAAVVVGQNFRFGHRAAGDVSTLRRLGEKFGFATEGVPLLPDGGVTISSTYVRSCIDAGEVAAAAGALGRPHRVDGLVVRGDMRGRALGYPTANLRTGAHVAVPADGVYAGYVAYGPDRLPAAVSVGTNPTFEGRERRIEAYILDFDKDIYGESIGVEFVRRLRPMARFDSVEELVAAIDADVAQVRDLLA